MNVRSIEPVAMDFFHSSACCVTWLTCNFVKLVCSLFLKCLSVLAFLTRSNQLPSPLISTSTPAGREQAWFTARVCILQRKEGMQLANRTTCRADPDRNHLLKWFGVMRIHFALNECALGVDAIDPHWIWIGSGSDV